MATPIQRACKIAGGQAALAKALGVHPSFVSQLATGRKPIPAEHCPNIERATGIPCEELRPDVNWSVLRVVTKRARKTA